MEKILSKIILRVIIYAHLFMILSLVWSHLTPFLYSKRSYIEHVDVSPEKKLFTDRLIKKMGLKNDGSRPIIIVEGKTHGTALGMAYSTYSMCVIKMKSDLDPPVYIWVLAHEVLHCLAYDHVDSDCDIMKPYFQGCQSLKNLRKYIEKVKDDE